MLQTTAPDGQNVRSGNGIDAKDAVAFVSAVRDLLWREEPEPFTQGEGGAAPVARFNVGKMLDYRDLAETLGEMLDALHLSPDETVDSPEWQPVALVPATAAQFPDLVDALRSAAGEVVEAWTEYGTTGDPNDEAAELRLAAAIHRLGCANEGAPEAVVLTPLEQFAQAALSIMTRDEEWDSDTLSEIAEVAVNLNVAHVSTCGRALFRSGPQPLL